MAVLTIELAKESMSILFGISFLFLYYEYAVNVIFSKQNQNHF